MSTNLTPAQAWKRLQDGNARFVADAMQHPSQGAAHRTVVAKEQHPYAVLFGCSDSRVAAEIIFDQGLGDLFVVRTAGHVLDTTVIGSIEYGVDVLGAPLVVVLGHDRCGAVGAATEALMTGKMPTGFVRAVVDRVIPSLLTHAQLAGPDAGGGTARDDGAPAVGGSAAGGPRSVTLPDDDELRREHVRATVQMLRDYSGSLATSVAEGRCAIVGVEYTLADGTAHVVDHVGPLGV
ncbi:carbonic anhydrase [Georgenia sp. EYE_87]|uniref:carbonic anhydrase n=1 Tax=Georgenia sp. EYE_87 TaxID=2853448 RepID=UPI0020043C5A|nr:carbonic anhydrase [Georgenia sp. EYE_87]MCK6210972.1 carbonic anhydrase [Georgenia sp. EYE_87]